MMVMVGFPWVGRVSPLAAGLALSLALPHFVAGSPSGLMSRSGVQSLAVCISEFNWMDNSLGQSPCKVAGFLLAACNGGNWIIDSVTASSHYAPPNSTTENGCQCSWAVYNTIQACADCQGEDFSSSMLSWAGWSGNCSSNFLSASIEYPSNTPIPDETAIPFWAITNPTTWHDGLFDPSAAQQLANEDKPDITEANRNGRSSSGKSDKGAIAGGVVGGVVGLAVIALLAYLLFRRSRGKGSARKNGRTGVQFRPVAHMRSESDMGRKYFDQASPGPTLDNGYVPGYGQHPGMQMTGSYTSYPSTTMTLTPPPAEVMGMGMQLGKSISPTPTHFVTVNPSSNPSYVSTAYATGPPSQGHTHTPSHSHTLSGQSTYSTAPSVESRAGAISPFLLPPAPTLPEPMVVDEDPAFSRAAAAAARKNERRNPPAYSPTPEDDDEIEAVPAGRSESVDVQAAETETTAATAALSGTTLLQSSGPRAHTDERDRYGYPMERKT